SRAASVARRDRQARGVSRVSEAGTPSTSAVAVQQAQRTVSNGGSRGALRTLLSFAHRDSGVLGVVNSRTPARNRTQRASSRFTVEATWAEMTHRPAHGSSRLVEEHSGTPRQSEQQVLVERLITTFSASFVNLSAEQIDAKIAGALSAIGHCLAVDRCSIALLSETGDVLQT